MYYDSISVRCQKNYKLDVNCSYGLHNVFLGGFVSFLIGDDINNGPKLNQVSTLTEIRVQNNIA